MTKEGLLLRVLVNEDFQMIDSQNNDVKDLSTIRHFYGHIASSTSFFSLQFL